MSVQTLYTAATGMDALETKLDVIANNLANVNTTAFKEDRANFQDLFYRQIRYPGALDADGNITSTGIEVGLGARVSSTQTNYMQGAFETTNRPLDLAIEGKGFFRVNDATNGGTLYTRAGNFSINANNQLVIGSASTGRLLVPNKTAWSSIRRSPFRSKRRTSSSRPMDRFSTAPPPTRRCKTPDKSCCPSFSTPTA